MNPEINQSAVQELIRTARENNLLFYQTPRVSLSWNDKLFLWGGWPLAIAYYGVLFGIFWIFCYYFLRGFYEEKKEKV